MKNKNIYHFWL